MGRFWTETRRVGAGVLWSRVRTLHGLAIPVGGEFARQPRSMAGRPRHGERTPRFLQKARAAARVAEDHGEAGALLDHERGLGVGARPGRRGPGPPRGYP